jgi:hypothetical protein
VAFSFAGPHRSRAESIATLLAQALAPTATELRNSGVFFDEWFQHEILGADMDVCLQRIYSTDSLMVACDLSDAYADRPWTQAEARAIRALRFSIDSARDTLARLRIINLRFAPGEVPGIFRTEGYIDVSTMTDAQCVDVLLKRLRLLTEGLRQGDASKAEALQKPTVAVRYEHPATHDQHYARREMALRWLDDCSHRSTIRVATITGQGGLGKTALVGHWLSRSGDWNRRHFCAALFYSFYSELDTRVFFKTLVEFVCATSGVPMPRAGYPLHHAAANALRRLRYLIVLDGLEVLQHSEDDATHYGWIADTELNEFVSRVAEDGDSLLLLTSRFPFPRVAELHPDAVASLELGLLSADEGADLLKGCGLNADVERLRFYSTLLGGHPLALRLFAGACLEQPFSDPEALAADITAPHDFAALPGEEPDSADPDYRRRQVQRRQFYKLLRWFQRKLPPAKRRLLQLVSMFRQPVRTETITALASGLELARADFSGYDGPRLLVLLEQLCRQTLLQKEQGEKGIRWTCHPIVREVARMEMFTGGESIAKSFAEIVAGKSDGTAPTSVSQVVPVVSAIEALLLAGDVVAADSLYRQRLDDGAVFQSVLAPEEGLRCVMAFFVAPAGRDVLELRLGRQRLASYLLALALSSVLVGSTDKVVALYEDAARLYHAEQDWAALSDCLMDLADSLILTGDLAGAVKAATESIHYAGVPDDEIGPSNDAGWTATGTPKLPPRAAFSGHRDLRREWEARCYRAHALSVAGRMTAASRDYLAADRTCRAENRGAPIYSIGAVFLAQHLSRLALQGIARHVARAGLATSGHNGWQDDAKRFELLIAEQEMLAGDVMSAAPRIEDAVSMFRRVRLFVDLPDALILGALVAHNSVQALTEEQKTEWLADAHNLALIQCEEAYRIAARAGYALKKCDALIATARCQLRLGKQVEARRNAVDAQWLAMNADYFWAQYDAANLLKEICRQAGQHEEAHSWESAAAAFAKGAEEDLKSARQLFLDYEASTTGGRRFGRKGTGK